MRSPKQNRARHASRAAVQDVNPTPAALRSIVYAAQNQDLEMVRLLTVQECGRVSGESPWTWRERAYKGIVASVKMGGPQSRLLIPLSEVQRLIAEGTRPAIVA